MAICAETVVSEWQAEWERIGPQIDNSSLWKAKWLTCVGNEAKKPVKCDQFLAKLHLDMIEELIDRNGEQQQEEKLKFSQKLNLTTRKHSEEFGVQFCHILVWHTYLRK